MVDPMHYLLLRSAKTFVTLWKNQLSESYDFACMQTAVNQFVIPAGNGRIPGKIENGFKNFKADQWKNWILIYSLVCFKPINTYTVCKSICNILFVCNII